MDLSDQILVAKVKSGDYQAFESLVNRYESKVYRLALRMLRNPQDAEDALQETFIQVYRGLPGFEGRSAFSTWLFRLATNACLMKIRHRATEPPRLLPLEDYLPRQEQGEIPQMVDWTDRPEEALLSKESREKMMEALEKLPLEYRAVFILRDIEGFSNAETGESLGISVAAVKSRLHRARLALRGMLSEYFERRGELRVHESGMEALIMEKDEKATPVFACKRIECKELLEKLSEYIDGELDPKLCADLEKHMADCNPCLVFVNTLKKTISLFKYASSEPLPKEVHLRLHDYLKKNCQGC